MVCIERGGNEGVSVFSPVFFDKIWGHPYSKPPKYMQRAHHPHSSIYGKSVPQYLSFFAWMQ